MAGRRGLLQLGEAPAVGVFGHYGNQNLGDEAIIEAVLRNCRARLPGGRLIGFSLRPDDTAQRHGVEAYPIRRLPRTTAPAAGSPPEPSAGQAPAAPPQTPAAWRRWLGWPWRLARSGAGRVLDLARELGFLATSYRRLRGLDALLIVGSNQFLDNYGGPWGFPYTLLKWAVLARLGGTRLAFVSVGAGPLDQQASHRMVRWAIALSAYCSCRDEHSQALLQAIGVPPPAIYPDLAFSLEPAAVQARGAGAGMLRVGLNPMPMYDKRYWYLEDDARYADYVDKLARFGDAVMADGHHLCLWGTQPKDYNVVDDLLLVLRERFRREPGALLSVARPVTVAELQGLIGGFDLAVATRFHGIVLPLSVACPVVGISYYAKIGCVLAAMGQAEYAVDVDDFAPGELQGKFQRLADRRVAASRTIAERANQARTALAEQYDRLLGPVAAAGTGRLAA